MSEPRLFRPEKGNPYYIYVKDGGVNPARGNPMRRDQYLTSLPNCIMIYGWFNEIGQRGQIYLTKAWYPYSVIAAAKNEGLEVTTEPTKGGIMVWTGGKTNEGHVAGVGEVYDGDHILTVESEYYGKDWKLYNRTKDDGNWRRGCPWMDRSYQYQGCIKNPFMEEDMTKAETEALIKSMFPGMFDDNMARYNKELKDKPADPYAVDALSWAKSMGYMVGDPTGNQMPQSPVKREDLAVVLKGILTE